MRSLTPEHRWKDRYQGDHLFIGFSDADMDREAATRHDVYAKLVADPGMVEAFARAGLPPMRHWAGSVMSKPPKGPPLYWHHVRLRPPLPVPAGQPPSRLGHPAPTMTTCLPVQDWAFFDHPLSSKPLGTQIFAMVYLTRTTPENGGDHPPTCAA